MIMRLPGLTASLAEAHRRAKALRQQRFRPFDSLPPHHGSTFSDELQWRAQFRRKLSTEPMRILDLRGTTY
jgi:hypothetical protein